MDDTVQPVGSLARQRAARAAEAAAQLSLGDAAYKNTGTAAGTVAAGDDARFSTIPESLPTGVTYIRSDDIRLVNARIPNSHAASHASDATDPVLPASIGAVATPALGGVFDIDDPNLVWDIDTFEQVVDEDFA